MDAGLIDGSSIVSCIIGQMFYFYELNASVSVRVSPVDSKLRIPTSTNV